MNEQAPRRAAPKSGPTHGGPRAECTELYKLACEEGKRTVDDQLAELDSMRQRTVQFLAFVGSATAFLVGTGLHAVSRNSGFYAVASIATLLSALSVILCLSILVASSRPWSRELEQWSFRLSPSALVKWIEPDVHPPRDYDFYRALALQYEAMAEANAPSLDRIRRRYLIFLVMGFGQLCGWVALAWLFG